MLPGREGGGRGQRLVPKWLQAQLRWLRRQGRGQERCLLEGVGERNRKRGEVQDPWSGKTGAHERSVVPRLRLRKFNPDLAGQCSRPRAPGRLAA